MEFRIKEKAADDLSKVDHGLAELFYRHFEKTCAMPPRRHLRFGLPFNVEEVTKQARFVYQTEGGLLIVLRCFATHKEYERWFKSFK